MNRVLRRAGRSLLASAILTTALITAGDLISPRFAHGMQGATVPAVTLLYQNFPNPFPTSGTAITCIWFDLHRVSQVRLTIQDLRGTVLRTIVPSVYLSSSFPAGRFGRGSPEANSGCDPRFSWDGKDDRGRTVSPGIYIVRLRTEGFEGVKKIVFRGR